MISVKKSEVDIGKQILLDETANSSGGRRRRSENIFQRVTIFEHRFGEACLFIAVSPAPRAVSVTE